MLPPSATHPLMPAHATTTPSHTLHLLHLTTATHCHPPPHHTHCTPPHTMPLLPTPAPALTLNPTLTPPLPPHHACTTAHLQSRTQPGDHCLHTPACSPSLHSCTHHPCVHHAREVGCCGAQTTSLSACHARDSVSMDTLLHCVHLVLHALPHTSAALGCVGMELVVWGCFVCHAHTCSRTHTSAACCVPVLHNSMHPHYHSPCCNYTTAHCPQLLPCLTVTPLHQLCVSKRRRAGQLCVSRWRRAGQLCM